MKNENCKSIKKKQKNLNIDLGNSQENLTYKVEKNYREIYLNNGNSNFINSTQSIEL
jgi:hypothetical protein